uniref:BTB domain-containing protein n=1 Tax=Sinocyclocheilus grahami TaxID=75366 RepID=A0A672JZS8_SINGR
LGFKNSSSFSLSSSSLSCRLLFLIAGTLCDTLLTVEGLSFKAHALILALASKRLKRQLTKQHGPGYCCVIERVSSHTFKQILDYMYSELLEVPKDDLEELLRGAEYLEVESLVEQCQAQLRDPESPTKTDSKVIRHLGVVSMVKEISFFFFF